MVNHLSKSLKASVTSATLILKLVVPFYILADILLYFDLLRPVSFLFSPVTTILQLPAETAMAICAGVFLNLYAAVAFAAPLGLSSYEWTILGIFLGVCHSLPVENTIMKKLGISFLYSTLLRISMAFLTTLPLLLLPDSFFTGKNSGKAIELTTYSSIPDMLLHSLINAALLSTKIICLITVVIFLMDGLQRTKFITNYGQRVQTSFSLLTGQLLGITYGAGILFKEANSGNLKKKDIFFVGTFLMICHSLLEDTLLFVIFGANYWVIIVSRLAMACLVTFLLSRIFRARDNKSKTTDPGISSDHYHLQ
ncbi:MAG TPA: nucleoside recognition protein [Desulfocapsa sulfexigens]|nr:nucleoside recognition protein [Desulfocapsa sulfexigens]